MTELILTVNLDRSFFLKVIEHRQIRYVIYLIQERRTAVIPSLDFFGTDCFINRCITRFGVPHLCVRLSDLCELVLIIFHTRYHIRFFCGIGRVRMQNKRINVFPHSFIHTIIKIRFSRFIPCCGYRNTRD